MCKGRRPRCGCCCCHVWLAGRQALQCPPDKPSCGGGGHKGGTVLWVLPEWASAWGEVRCQTRARRMVVVIVAPCQVRMLLCSFRAYLAACRVFRAAGAVGYASMHAGNNCSTGWGLQSVLHIYCSSTFVTPHWHSDWHWTAGQVNCKRCTVRDLLHRFSLHIIRLVVLLYLVGPCHERHTPIHHTNTHTCVAAPLMASVLPQGFWTIVYTHPHTHTCILFFRLHLSQHLSRERRTGVLVGSTRCETGCLFVSHAVACGVQRGDGCWHCH